MKREARDYIVSLTDFHVPFSDVKVNDVSFKLCKMLQPKIIIIHELVDFYALSRFDKDPRRALELQEELDEARKILGILRKYCPKTRIVMLESNHDKRLKKYLNGQSPALRYLQCLEFSELLGLDKFNIEYKDSFEFRGVLFKHGDLVRKFSGYTAKGEFEKEGMSVVIGHTHRLGMHFRTLRAGEYVSIESGCQCEFDQGYISGTADWQHGLSVIAFRKNSDQYYPAVVPIIKIKEKGRWRQSIMWGRTTLFSK